MKINAKYQLYFKKRTIKNNCKFPLKNMLLLNEKLIIYTKYHLLILNYPNKAENKQKYM